MPRRARFRQLVKVTHRGCAIARALGPPRSRMAPPVEAVHARGGARLEGNFVIILGIICIIVGLLVSSLNFLLWVGIVLLVVGLILNFVPIGGRRRRIF